MPAIDVKHGTFGWADLMTTDVAAVTPFYQTVFGWTTQEMPGGHGPYHMFFLGDVPAAGMAEMDEEFKEQGAHPSWNSYVEVDDLEAAVARVPALGGEVVFPAMEAGEHGRMSMVKDPSGAHVTLWQSSTTPNEGRYNEPGLLTWNELITRDPDAARPFYGELLGWEWEKLEMPTGTYWVIKTDGRSNGGLMQMTDEWPDFVPSHWMVYFGTDNVDAAAERVRAAGGSLAVEPMDIPVGRFCVAADPSGAVFTMFKGGDM